MSALGFLLLDKPKEMASFSLVKALRKIFNMKRIGYAGTLDPLATGLMIMAVGEATKLLYDLEQTDKVYDVKIKLGATSETYDAEGPIHVFQNPAVPKLAEIKKIIEENFIGESMQVPPRYSAVKIQGKHAYDLVRKGKEVIIPPRKVRIFDIKIHAYEYPILECSVHCAAGTYIRSFAHDLGQKLGCGAYVEELRRTQIGRHHVGDAIALQTLTIESCREFLRPPEKFLADWQQAELTEQEYVFLTNGGFLPNRWELKERPALGLYNSITVGQLELCEGGRSVKFAKRFNLG